MGTGIRTCPHCGAPVAAGAPEEWSGRRGDYECTVRGAIFLSCPAGCGRVEPDAMASIKMAVAFSRALSELFPRRRGIFRRRSVCRSCRSDLILGDPAFTHALTIPNPGGTPLEVSMKGPSLLCISCGKRHLNFPDGKGLEEFGAPLLGFFGEPEIGTRREGQ